MDVNPSVLATMLVHGSHGSTSLEKHGYNMFAKGGKSLNGRSATYFRYLADTYSGVCDTTSVPTD